MRCSFIIVVLCFFQAALFAQSEGENAKPKFDPNYIESFYNDLIVRVYSSEKDHSVQFKDVEANLPLLYKPNGFYSWGVGFNYKWFGLNVGAKMPFLATDDDNYGKTTSFGLQSYLYARRFTLDVLALRSKGYYLNTGKIGDFEDSFQDDFYKRRDLQTENYGLNFNYVLNFKRFSYKAAFKQNELQKRSAGSIILGSAFQLFQMEADTAFVPREIDSAFFENWRELNAFDSYSFSASVGYAYSFVPGKNWIFTGSYKVGVVAAQSKWNLLNDEAWMLKWGRTTEFRFSGGKHFKSVYLGASFVSYQQTSVMEHRMMSIKNVTQFIEFTLSKRIKL